ncbi:hypothetical protein FB45DRAFT_759713 [Roridomyces roridus]|uniref:T6SS Phospholipase effector Tle1-like catalytic domain-containing protein n=1 Tax=Roridomyces roridus TaxID=1738132 RepID=A0AAD7B768_9AGAR|nr:hypothetical protein FB45DRAFT_759713 [Roridomyces roridus]
MASPPPAVDPVESRLRALEDTVERLQKRPDVTHTQCCHCTESARPPPSGRRLIIALDGTANKFGAQSSHVVEFCSRVMKTEDQPSYYTSGIGTYTKKTGLMNTVSAFLKHTWASATAWNFKSNILAGYHWLSENYKPGDQIFLLGYSRGAYQVRVLAAMITKANIEPFHFAYFDVARARWVSTTAREFKRSFSHDVTIHLLADTVSSVGLFRAKRYPGALGADNICFLRHALALDERRVKFLPEYVTGPRSLFERGEFGQPRCKEVWFRGCHSDRINFTSDNGAVPSRWMAYEAMLAGLEMAPFKRNVGTQDLTGLPPSKSMTFLYNIIEYLPLVSWTDPSVSPIDPPDGVEPRPVPQNKRCAIFYSKVYS